MLEHHVAEEREAVLHRRLLEQHVSHQQLEGEADQVQQTHPAQQRAPPEPVIMCRCLQRITGRKYAVSTQLAWIWPLNDLDVTKIIHTPILWRALHAFLVLGKTGPEWQFTHLRSYCIYWPIVSRGTMGRKRNKGFAGVGVLIGPKTVLLYVLGFHGYFITYKACEKLLMVDIYLRKHFFKQF